MRELDDPDHAHHEPCRGKLNQKDQLPHQGLHLQLAVAEHGSRAERARRLMAVFAEPSAVTRSLGGAAMNEGGDFFSWCGMRRAA